MNDENKNNPDFEDGENFDDFEDAFDDDFNEETTEVGSDPASAPASAPSEASKETVIDRPQKKSGSLLPIIIGLGVLCFFGWKIFQNFSGSSKKPAPEQQPAVAIATPTVEPIAEPILKPLVDEKPLEIAPAVATPSAEEKKLTQVETQIATQDKLYHQKIEILEKELALAKQSTENTSRVVEGLSHDISTLTSSVQQLSEQIDNLREYQEREVLRKEQTRSPSKPKRSAAPSADKNTSLTVYAIIPGRAWLRNPNGKTITVTEGDTLAEFGKVLKIDASNGVVVTTSGVTLR